jgi:hypothetical protein
MPAERATSAAAVTASKGQGQARVGSLPQRPAGPGTGDGGRPEPHGERHDHHPEHEPQGEAHHEGQQRQGEEQRVAGVEEPAARHQQAVGDGVGGSGAGGGDDGQRQRPHRSEDGGVAPEERGGDGPDGPVALRERVELARRSPDGGRGHGRFSPSRCRDGSTLRVDTKHVK